MNFIATLRDININAIKKDNLYNFVLNGEKIYFIAEGFGCRIKTGAFLVGLSGAVTGRDKKTPPFFSGQKMAQILNRPLISFSDPTLHRSEEVSLGFYAGNDRVPSLPKILAKIISSISYETGQSAVLFGGSGGGFAALNILRHCNNSCCSFIWNPQTLLTAYYRRHVMSYLKAAFPELYQHARLNNIQSPSVLAGLLRSADCHPGVVPWVPVGKVFLMQSSSDGFHVENHLLPFVQAGNWKRVGSSVYRDDELNIEVCVGDWGEGHVPPPREVILKALGALAVNTEHKTLLADISADLKIAPDWSRWSDGKISIGADAE